MDSKLAVDILEMKCECSWRVLSITATIKTTLQRMDNYWIRHCQREANKPADFLASWDIGTDEI